MTIERPSQEVPDQIVMDLLCAIRNQFYADATLKKWFQDTPFLRRRVVFWPAAWLTKRGVSLKPERYKEILLGIFQDVKRYGQTDVVKFWPGYLAHCVQEHFRHHGDTYYEEGKSLRAAIERSMMALSRSKEAALTADPVTILAQAHAVLAARPRSRKSPSRQLALDL